MPRFTLDLWSKVLRLVRHPGAGWSEPEPVRRGPETQEHGTAALPAALRRSLRNDRVRQHELDSLRAVMRAQWQMADQSAAATAFAQDRPTATQPSLLPGFEHSKSHTIAQIARIERQMAQNWSGLRNEGEPLGLRIASSKPVPPRLGSGDTPPSAHLAARLVLPGVPASPEGAGASQLGSTPDDWLAHPGIADAAVRFANADYEMAEQGLRALMVPQPLALTARLAGLAVLDVLHARRHFEGFEEFAAEYAERFRVPVPRWPADAQHSAAGGADVHGAGKSVSESASWVCPLFLDAAAVQALAHAMAGPGAAKLLDWTGLLSADLSAAQALLDEVTRWLERPLELSFLGAAVLRRRLKASTPSGRRENEPLWWRLRLALLRVMRRRDEFELVALDYCVTYGVLPPLWEEPLCRFALADGVSMAQPKAQSVPAIQPLDTQLAGMEVLEESELPCPTGMFADADADAQAAALEPAPLPAVDAAAIRLRGVWSGDMLAAVAELDQALVRHAPGQVLVIDCRWLDRVDLAAAGSLLQWLTLARSRGIRVELHGLSRLVAAFFHVVGIADMVTLRLRQY